MTEGPPQRPNAPAVHGDLTCDRIRVTVSARERLDPLPPSRDRLGDGIAILIPQQPRINQPAARRDRVAFELVDRSWSWRRSGVDPTQRRGRDGELEAERCAFE